MERFVHKLRVDRALLFPVMNCHSAISVWGRQSWSFWERKSRKLIFLAGLLLQEVDVCVRIVLVRVTGLGRQICKKAVSSPGFWIPPIPRYDEQVRESLKMFLRGGCGIVKLC